MHARGLPDPVCMATLAALRAPQYSARRGGYRVLYLIDDDRVIVDITSMTHRADAFRRR
jgi:mRNA-degrading endonuclease RelE of RelBE toxin-antitoxin system